MHHQRVSSWEWPLCWPWPHWCPRPMRHCQRFPTSNRSTSTWALVSWWFSPHYWSTPPWATWANVLRCARIVPNRWENFFKPIEFHRCRHRRILRWDQIHMLRFVWVKWTWLARRNNGSQWPIKCRWVGRVWVEVSFWKLFLQEMRYRLISGTGQEPKPRPSFEFAKKKMSLAPMESDVEEGGGGAPATPSTPPPTIPLPGLKNQNSLFGVCPSDIDKYSRVVFPVCFLCFNLMYWIIYMHISEFLTGEIEE